VKYGSVCSGIEAATTAWHPLGWTPAFFSEIEAFPSALLASKHPAVPNHGDMTKFRGWPDHTIDLLVGGTPCQSFSVAGIRKGLADPRGNLALVFLALAERFKPKWIVWENVPGVLSSGGGRDFGSFLGGLVELGYGFAYRVLDAQFVRVESHPWAVPQRRRRVFVVGYLGDWRRAAAVLFEPESLQGHPPPRREAGQGLTRGFETGPHGGGFTDIAPTMDARAKDAPIRNQLGVGVITSTGSVPHCLNAGAMGRIDYETETMVAHALRREGHDASEDGTGRGTPIAFPACLSGTQCVGAENLSPAIGALNPIAIAIQERAICENPDAGPDGVGVRDDGAAYTLEARQVPQAVAAPMTLAIRGRGDTHNLEYRQDGTANAVLTPNGGRAGIGVGDSAHGWAVRRLTPLECERLQGFPDNYTAITYRGKPAADGPRYKALGNSMAVNCMRWIGERIAAVDAT
jgi:DNA (cytosine-5)-methyltransferase 1